MRKILAPNAARLSGAVLYLLLPLLPFVAALLFLRWRFVRDYAQTLRGMRVHLAAMRRGPLQHYFSDVLGRVRQVPQDVHGSCVQCGNCCLERKCVFLVAVADNKYQCGIYESRWRRFSNCGSFPLNQQDIDRYACPSYFVVPRPVADATSPVQGLRPVPVRFVGKLADLRSLE